MLTYTVHMPVKFCPVNGYIIICRYSLISMEKGSRWVLLKKLTQSLHAGHGILFACLYTVAAKDSNLNHSFLVLTMIIGVIHVGKGVFHDALIHCS